MRFIERLNNNYMKVKNYQLNESEVQTIVTSLSCTLMSKLPNDTAEQIKSIINYLLKGGRNV